MLASLFNWLTDKVSYILQVVLLVLPDSPFVMITADAEIQQYLRWINWVIPVSAMVAIMQAWLIAIAIYYVYMAILRFGKVIE